MGSRGPGATPTRLKILRGTERKSRRNLREPRPLARPKMPMDMSDDAKRVWRRVMRAYGPTGVITGADGDAFRVYCEAVARYVQAARTLEASGPLVRGARSGELVKNPLHQIVRDNAILLRAFARELGLTPSARTGLTEAIGAVDDDPLEAWLRRGP
jgi:P27 family predicted phage terminase small subunit